jgi:hypothetical protein
MLKCFEKSLLAPDFFRFVSGPLHEVNFCSHDPERTRERGHVDV